MKYLTLQPIAKINGNINLPGSKSISNRALLLAALSNKTTILTNILNSEDTCYMLSALRELGVNFILSNNRKNCKIIGNNVAFLHTVVNEVKLFLGNAGTVMRFLTAILCLSRGNVILTGSKRMKERPIGHLVDALRQGGAQIEYLERESYPPLRLLGGFNGGEITLDSSLSSQFLTALLIIAPLASKNTVINIKSIVVSKPYINITLHMMRIFGIEVENQFYKRFIIRGRQKYISPGYYLIEGDASSASYFLAAAAIKGGTIKVKGAGKKSIQGDILFANVLEKMGAIITWGDSYIICSRGTLNAIDMDMNHIPDTAMTIAITALFAKGITTLRNIYNWRIKETDRLFAMASELRKIGALIKEGENYIRITPPLKFQFAKIDTYDDHRIAMCFSLIALSGVSVSILSPKCVSKTYPDYFKQLTRVSISS